MVMAMRDSCKEVDTVFSTSEGFLQQRCLVDEKATESTSFLPCIAQSRRQAENLT